MKVIDSIIVKRVLELKNCKEPSFRKEIINDINKYLEVLGFKGQFFVSNNRLNCSSLECKEYINKILKERGFNNIF